MSRDPDNLKASNEVGEIVWQVYKRGGGAHISYPWYLFWAPGSVEVMARAGHSKLPDSVEAVKKMATELNADPQRLLALVAEKSAGLTGRARSLMEDALEAAKKAEEVADALDDRLRNAACGAAFDRGMRETKL